MSSKINCKCPLCNETITDPIDWCVAMNTCWRCQYIEDYNDEEELYPACSCMKCGCALTAETERHGSHCYECHVVVMNEQLNPRPLMEKPIDYKEMPDFFEPNGDDLPF